MAEEEGVTELPSWQPYRTAIVASTAYPYFAWERNTLLSMLNTLWFETGMEGLKLYEEINFSSFFQNLKNIYFTYILGLEGILKKI